MVDFLGLIFCLQLEIIILFIKADGLRPKDKGLLPKFCLYGREKKVVDFNSGSLWESITLTTVGRDRRILLDMIEEAKEMALKEEEGTTIIYTAIGPEWRQFGFPRERRPFESVILDQGLANSLYGDVTEFLKNAAWYRERGIPYRRGYLLYGPPGCGKSSFIQALAGKLEYNICVLSLSDRGLTDDRLNYLLVVAPQRSVILLEDIDAAFGESHRSVNSAYQNQLTFSGVLNALDGVAASEARILFMTTNHIEKLDPALIRPGRVDRKEYIGNASKSMMKDLWKRFYPQESLEIWEKFSPNLEENKFSMAELQGIFLLNKHNGEHALKTLIEKQDQFKEIPDRTKSLD